jgi:hypothetical protein
LAVEKTPEDRDLHVSDGIEVEVEATDRDISVADSIGAEEDS